MEGKKPFYKKWWFILIAFVFVFGAIANLFESDESDQEGKNKEVAAEQKKGNEKTDKEEKERLKNRSIDKKIEEDNEDVDSAKLKDGNLTLKQEAKSMWSENSLFLNVYDLFEAMNTAFKDESVDAVDIVITTVMTDQKGNESTEPVIKYTYTKDTFKELNYDKFSDMAFGQQWRILNESDSYFIHPGIYKNLKDKYTDNLTNGKSKTRS